MTDTPLDRHHRTADAGDEAARQRFYDTLVSAEMFLLLDSEAEGDQISPRIFNTEDGDFLLVFDQEARLAEFVGSTAPYVAMSGRSIVEMMAGQGYGIALNPAVAPSSQLITGGIVDWLAANLVETPKPVGDKPSEIGPPGELPETLLMALDEKLASFGGLARLAYLVSAGFGQRRGHLLAIINAAPEAETAIATSISQTLAFSGLDSATLDVAFFDASDEFAARLAKVGLRFDLPDVQPSQPSAPGTDPNRPPKLR